MKVMMVQLPHFHNGVRRSPAVYPLGIGYLVSVLKGRHDLIPLDLWLEDVPLNRAFKLIDKAKPDVFCVSVYAAQYSYFKPFAAELKKRYPKKKIIAGGPGATFSWKVFLQKTAVDYCVLGEAEDTLKELLENMESPGHVPGIAYKKGGKVVLTPKRAQIRDLDTLPFPDRDFFDIERYISSYQASDCGKFKGLRTLNIIAGRGCPYHCVYCSKTFYGCRTRSVRSIGEEIKALKEKYGVQALDFNDELVIISRKRTLDLCKVLKKFDLKWFCQGRINVMSREILGAMKEAGCESIGYGVEAYTQRILDSMRKEVFVKDIVPVIKMTRAAGIEPRIQYMYALPGEDGNSIKDTMRFFEEADLPYESVATIVFPGTKLYEDVKNKKLISDEEKYLLNLDDGYTKDLPQVNLTGFSDKELISRKRNLGKAINKKYYRRHPLFRDK
ncbi:MAG: radical SAM protein [Elusimicrobiota bacterium]|nr:radical SAM protein [Elusimicrobiota bacterium]